MTETIDAHIRGTFYRRPDPSAQPFVETGDTVEEGDVVGLIEVMKTFNELKADTAGTVKEFRVENEELVADGQPIVELE